MHTPTALLSRGAAVLFLSTCAPASDDLYTYTDEAGVLHITDSPSDARYRLALVEPQPAPAHVSTVPVVSAPAAAAVPPGAASTAAANTANAAVWHPLIERAAIRHNVAVALVRAVIQAESNFNSRVVSPKGAQGQWQARGAGGRQTTGAAFGGKPRPRRPGAAAGTVAAAHQCA